MSKICPICNHEWPDNFQSCPLDSTPLINKIESTSGFSLNLGDANAVSGGINLSDNHSINTTNTHNVDSHNVITNNITQIEREKSIEEIKHEKEQSFREACKNVYQHGLMTSDNKKKLEDIQYQLGLDGITASRIISEVARRFEKKSDVLSPVHQITFNNIKTAISANRLDIVNRLLAQMKAMVQRYSTEDVQYTYYMLQAILHPNTCIVDYENQQEDKYWQSFWSSIAYRKVGDIEKSEILVADIGDKWIDIIPQENVFILAAVNAMLDKDYESAKSLYDNVTGEHSTLLTELVSCIYTLLYRDALAVDDLKQMQQECKFYSVNLFDSCNVPQISHNETLNFEHFEAKEIHAVDASQSNAAEPKQEVEVVQTQKVAIPEKKIVSPSKAEIPIIPQAEPKKELDIMSNPMLLFELLSKTTTEQMRTYNLLLESASKGDGKAGVYLAYFYLHGIIVSADLKEAEKRILNSNYQNDPILIQLLIELYNKKGVAALADVWKRKLNALKK
ncbi:MAG: hypothetical protein IIX52_06600 [Paludibacteraceae bacterium]|nr:hypothetical protein [Paludibacteraceae bacterium]